jgi:hypothetical protein
MTLYCLLSVSSYISSFTLVTQGTFSYVLLQDNREYQLYVVIGYHAWADATPVDVVAKKGNVRF